MKDVRKEGLAAFGPGKVILLGEHAVVYGFPALAGPINRGVRATGVRSASCRLTVPRALKGARRKLLIEAFARAARACGEPPISVRLESDLPLSMGLGSSAALSVAVSRLLLEAAGRELSPRTVCPVALEMEKVFHGTPSGVDHTTSAQQCLIRYERSPRSSVGRVRSIRASRPLRLLVVLVGQRGSTLSTVSSLRERSGRWPKRYRRLFEHIGSLADEGVRAVTRGDLEGLGDLMNINQGLLSAMQLSSPPLEQMVHRLRAMGALGAKLTGAGGDGGAVVGLFLNPEQAMARLSADGIPCFASQIAGPAVL